MDMALKESFLTRWAKYFPGADLPITFYYTDEEGHGRKVIRSPARHCFIAELGAVRKGRSLCFGIDSLDCAGGRRYLGFSRSLRPNFPYFLSCGIPGELEGERYKKTPEIVEKMMEGQPFVDAPAKYIVFKRFGKLEVNNSPMCVIFFATPDVLSGLFTLANYEEHDLNGVIAPMGSGCSSIVRHPLQEAKQPSPRAVLGMFDVSARPHIPSGMLTLTIPWGKFTRMVADMDESFLITKSWEKMRKRIKRAGKAE